MSYGHEKQFEEDIQSNVKKVMQENPSMSALDALSKVEKDMLKNNPFVPPTSGCPINILPNELISHIFFVGMTMEASFYGPDPPLDLTHLSI